MTIRCDYCHAPITKTRPGQRFCSDPGSTCRQDWHRANKLPGLIKNVHQLADGTWSVIVRYPKGRPPAVNRGSRVTLETDPIPRPDASSENIGSSDDDLLDIPRFLRKQAD